MWGKETIRNRREGGGSRGKRDSGVGERVKLSRKGEEHIQKKKNSGGEAMVK